MLAHVMFLNMTLYSHITSYIHLQKVFFLFCFFALFVWRNFTKRQLARTAKGVLGNQKAITTLLRLFFFSFLIYVSMCRVLFIFHYRTVSVAFVTFFILGSL